MASSMNELHESLRWRYAVKKYDAYRLPADALVALKDAVQLAPSSFGLQPYRAFFVEDAALRTELRKVSFDQPQITEASCLVVFAVENVLDESFIRRHFARITPQSEAVLHRREAVLRSLGRMTDDAKRTWATHQAYLALGFLLFAAAELRIDANPMEGFVARSYDALLGLTQQSTVVIAGLGRRSPDDRFQHFAKVRRPASELFTAVQP